MPDSKETGSLGQASPSLRRHSVNGLAQVGFALGLRACGVDANGTSTISTNPWGVRISLSSSPSGVFFPAGTYVDASGAATFSVAVPLTAGVYRLVATTPDGYTLTTPNSFTVVAGAAAKLAIVTQPSATAKSGVAFARQPEVQVVDAAGNPVSASTFVDVAISSGGGTLSTTTASTIYAGKAVFAGLAITGTLGPRTLTFSSPGLPAMASALVDVQP